MASDGITRRQAIVGSGALIGGGALAARSETVHSAIFTELDWRPADAPTTERLHDVVHASDGAVAVGESGVVLQRDPAGDADGDDGATGGWRAVVEEGPSGDARDLYGADVTDDGGRVWFAGASGAVGHHDGNAVVDRSEPDDYTGNVRDVAVAGPAGEETVRLVDDSGTMHRSDDAGETWTATTPGEGAAIPAVDVHDETAGHAADTNQTVYAFDGDTHAAVGIEDRDEAFFGVCSNGRENVWVVGDQGVVLRYDGDWRVTSLGDVELRDVDVVGTGFAVGSGGEIHAYHGEWHETTTTTDEDLYAVATGRDLPAVDVETALVVGASGTVLERA